MSLDDECAVCLEYLNTGDLAILDCKHIFHLDCINKWLSYDEYSKKRDKYSLKNSCPLCTIGREIICIQTDNRKIEKSRKIDVSREIEASKEIATNDINSNIIPLSEIGNSNPNIIQIADISDGFYLSPNDRPVIYNQMLDSHDTRTFSEHSNEVLIQPYFERRANTLEGNCPCCTIS